MTMLQLTKAELDKYDAFNLKLNSNIQRVTNAIPFQTIEPRVKAMIAVTQLTVFASQFRRNVRLWDDTLVPINTISFAILGSGAGKDSSVKAARKCFAPGYDLLLNTRKSIEVRAAQVAAANAGEESTLEYEVYKKYMRPLPPIDIMPTTGPGLIQHINDVGDLSLSASFVYSGEFSDELAYNQDMMECIKILSEVYDTGDKEVKYTKGTEFRSKAINGQAVSALMVGSPGHILYDEATKKKFHVAFMSKLARRSWFCYSPENIPEPTFDSVDSMLEYETKLELDALSARNAMSQHIKSVTEYGLSTAGTEISVPEEVFRLFKTYKRYNSELADSFPNQSSTSVLIRRHLQWKAIKLAGAFTIFDKSSSITATNYIDAIRFCELLSNDMALFEYDLSKSDHERFADYIRTQVLLDGKATISLHDLKKHNFITAVSHTKLKELIALASGYDKSGVYSLVNDGTAILYEPIVKTDVINVSYKPINISHLESAIIANDADAIANAKRDLATSAVYGFESGETSFADLAHLLSSSYAYSPFRFKNGVRGKDNILGGTKWLVFDIDHSHISASEAHFMLSDLNHHIALSTNVSNDYKFRVLLELDSVVDLDNLTWRHFYRLVAEHLALEVDLLPQSQIFFSYAGRPLMSVTDATPLEVRPFVMTAKDRVTNSPTITPLTTAQKKLLLADSMTTFAFAFNAPFGAGSRSVIRAMYYLKELGGTLAEALSLYDDIQDYWELPFEPTRSEAIRQQIRRMF